MGWLSRSEASIDLHSLTTLLLHALRTWISRDLKRGSVKPANFPVRCPKPFDCSTDVTLAIGTDGRPLKAQWTVKRCQLPLVTQM